MLRTLVSPQSIGAYLRAKYKNLQAKSRASEKRRNPMKKYLEYPAPSSVNYGSLSTYSGIQVVMETGRTELERIWGRCCNVEGGTGGINFCEDSWLRPGFEGSAAGSSLSLKFHKTLKIGLVYFFPLRSQELGEDTAHWWGLSAG